ADGRVVSSAGIGFTVPAVSCPLHSPHKDPSSPRSQKLEATTSQQSQNKQLILKKNPLKTAD
ncbi:MAG TPA: hypothetical protein VK608_01600, partial [Edaphobacter sp.]|nr:hypothetical protein [Edaphobacter sp.]